MSNLERQGANSWVSISNPDQRSLIVNADDFGMTRRVSEGIIEACERGILTSTSLMVRASGAEFAAAYARTHPEFSIGIHVDLGEWVCRDGVWSLRYQIVPLDDVDAVRREVAAQFDLFLKLVGRPPTHVDSHQHIHRKEPARAAVEDYVRRLGVPLRHFDSRIRYCGSFYGQTDEGETLPGALSVESLIELLKRLPAGVTELGCHPGYADDLDDVYATEREQELRVLCDPRSREALESLHISLTNFREITPKGIE